MFLGEYYLKFTGLGRVVLPKKIRSEVSGDRIVLSRGFEGCVLGFSLESWEKEANKQLEGSITEEKGRLLRRYVFSGSEIVDLDKQSRFVIPAGLLHFGSLRDEVVLIGAGDHFEIWNRIGWESYLLSMQKEVGV